MVKQSLERLQLKDVIYEHKRTKNYVLSDEYIKRMTQYNKEYDAIVSKIHDNLANKLKESISDITENLIKKIIVLFENYLALVFSLMSVARAPHKLISDDGTMILQVVGTLQAEVVRGRRPRDVHLRAQREPLRPLRRAPIQVEVHRKPL